MKNSEISWTTHTYNPWWGCIKVSPGCENCYAESQSKRYGFNIWGPAKTTERRLFGDKHWAEPLKWNKAAKEAGEHHRVFCASMADVFEEHPQVVDARRRLLELIVHTPHLDWLLLTKRPENVNRMIEQATGFSESDMWFHAVGDHVWIGTSVENQEYADKRIPELLNIPASTRFLSCEPLLGPVDIWRYTVPRFAADDYRHYPWRNGVEWVIAGGESGHHARPMHPDWARSLRDQCQAAGVPFHFKQHGEWLEFLDNSLQEPVCTTEKQQYMFPDRTIMVKVGKKAAGRLLDGREWNEYPTTEAEAPF